MGGGLARGGGPVQGCWIGGPMLGGMGEVRGEKKRAGQCWWALAFGPVKGGDGAGGGDGLSQGFWAEEGIEASGNE